MRILVLSDVHSNIRALDAVIEAAGPVDGLWLLGDIVGYGPDPDAVVARLRGLRATGVRGNHDLAALGGPEIELFNDDARRAMEWTKSVIAPETRQWLATLPERRTEGDFTLVHGSPRDPTWEYITSDEVARANLRHFDTPFCLFGHTHLPTVFRQTGGSSIEMVRPREGSSVTLDGRRALLNPGSVGQPRDGISTASFMVLDPNVREATWGRAAYDIAGTQAAMRAVHLPQPLVSRLDNGL
jgi:predicted phosphodiesterase